MAQTYIKDPEAILDYQWDWGDWLDSSETITSHTVTAETGLIVDSSSESDGAVTAWLSGGTAGDDYEVVCHVVTSAGREDDRTITIQARER